MQYVWNICEEIDSVRSYTVLIVCVRVSVDILRDWADCHVASSMHPSRDQRDGNII